MTDGAMTTLMVVFGVGLVVWLLVKRQEVAAPQPTLAPVPSLLGDGDIYSKGATLIYKAITDPDAIQHAVGLPGVDGWEGKGIFEAGAYPTLKPDQQLYYTWAMKAHMAQQLADRDEATRRLCYSIAIAILPASAAGTCCDFDPGIILSKGGGHAHYLGGGQVSFNRNGQQITAMMNLKLPPPGYSEDLTAYRIRAGIPLFSGTIPYNR